MIHAVIPTRFHPPELAALIKVLATDDIQYQIIESWYFDHRIYNMWNAGREMARLSGAGHVAYLNDDIAILPGTLPYMALALDQAPEVGVVYPDHRRATAEGLGPQPDLVPTTGTWGAGGMTGFCFMTRTDLNVPFDEDYHWWYGDDDFEDRVRQKGLLVARIDGLPIDHTPNGSAQKVWDELAPVIELDRNRWMSRKVAS